MQWHSVLWWVGEEVKTKNENSRMRVCAIAREGEEQVRKGYAKVGRFARKVVRCFEIVREFKDAFAITKSLE